MGFNFYYVIRLDEFRWLGKHEPETEKIDNAKKFDTITRADNVADGLRDMYPDLFVDTTK